VGAKKFPPYHPGQNSFPKPPCEVSSRIIYGLGLAPIASGLSMVLLNNACERRVSFRKQAKKHMSEEGPGLDLYYFGDGHISIPRED
jgi:hypothetical protein